MQNAHEVPLQCKFSACNQVSCSSHGLMDAAVAQTYLLGLTTVPELCLTGRPDLAGHEGGRTAAVMMSGIAGAGWLSEASWLQR